MKTVLRYAAVPSPQCALDYASAVPFPQRARRRTALQRQPHQPGVPCGRPCMGCSLLRPRQLRLRKTFLAGETVRGVDVGSPIGRRVEAGAEAAPTATSSGGSPSEMFQAALSSLELYPGHALTSMDSFDDIGEAHIGSDTIAEEINWEQTQPAASVGRAVYEVLRIDQAGKTRRIYVRRRDLLRSYGLQPRDLRRIDPSLSPTKTSPSVTVKESVLLVNLGGVRAIVSNEKCLLFEPASRASRRFLELVTPRLAEKASAGLMYAARGSVSVGAAAAAAAPGFDHEEGVPFELEMLEGALLVATGRLENELLNVTRRVSTMLQKLPREINPVNLEELRRVKQILVELESKADNMRSMLEELMDDEDDLREINLSSRPLREEKRRQREQKRLMQEVEREREWADREEARRSSSSESSTAQSAAAAPVTPPAGTTLPGSAGMGKGSRRAFIPAPASPSPSRERDSVPVPWGYYRKSSGDGREAREEGEGRDEEYADAEERLEVMAEADEEERELEEVEDLLEYYLQRATTTQSEAERLLAGARDLEESIGVSLSARRFEVNRLELTLSISSFAAAVGAMIAGIFGMNLRNTMEMSVVGFWSITVGICVGCAVIFVLLYRYTKRKRIL